MPIRLLLSLAPLVALAACSSPPPAAPTSPVGPPLAQSLTEIVADADDLTVLATLLSAANLTATLYDEGPFTLFAPSNEAFAALPMGTVERLLAPENRDELVSILSHHVVQGRLTSSSFRSGQTLRTLNGTSLGVRATNGQLRIGGSALLASDVEARNGLLYVTDSVLMP